MEFSKLDFAPRQDLEGIQAITFFPNGYGASVVKGFGSYGDEEGLYELAVLSGTEGTWEICYDTPITDGVLGHLSKDAVTEVLQEIEMLSLPPTQLS